MSLSLCGRKTWTQRVLSMPLALMVMIALLGAGSTLRAAQAANTLVVTTTADTNDGTCDADCSLREAVAAAADGDTININVLDGGTITLLSANGELLINKSVTINNVSTASTNGVVPFIRVSGTTSRDFEIAAGKTVAISNIEIVNGLETAGDGGGVLNYGALTLSNVTLYNNRAVNGAAIASSSTATSAASLTVQNVTISGNNATGSGGGIAVQSPNAGGTAALDSVTIYNNNAALNGGGIYRIGGNAGNVTIKNTIVAGNTASAAQNPGNDISSGAGGVVSQGNNLVKNTTSSGVTFGPSDVTGKDPNLANLTFNGGLTRTHALNNGSPAIDAGNTALTTDQRGQPRDQDGTGAVFNSNTGPDDIGAYELNAIADVGGVNKPVLDLNGSDAGKDYTRDFVVGQGAVNIEKNDSFTFSYFQGSDPNGDAYIFDADNVLRSLTVKITNLQDAANESLNADTAGTALTKSYDQASGTLTLTGQDSAANYSQVLQTVTYNYNTTAATANTTPRSVLFTVSDGTQTDTATTTVAIQTANRAPIVTPGTGDPYVESYGLGTGSTHDGRIAPNGTVHDPDVGYFIQALSATLNNRPDGNNTEQLVFSTINDFSLSDQIAKYNIIVGPYQTNSGSILISGAAPESVYTRILRAIYYQNSSQDPDTTDRSITVLAFDGNPNQINSTTNLSGAGTATVSVFKSNDSPFFASTPSDRFNFDGSQSVTFNTQNNNLIQIDDVDDEGKTMALTVAVTHGTVSLGSTNNIQIVAGGNNTDNFTIQGTKAAINNAVNGLVYTPDNTYTNSSVLTLRVQDNRLFKDNGQTLEDIGNTGSPSPGYQGLGVAPVRLINFYAANAVGQSPPVVKLDPDNSSGSGPKNYTTNYILSNGVGQGSVLVEDSDATITDPDGTIQSITITITNVQNQGDETLTGNSAGTQVQVTGNGTTLTITRAGTATLADMIKALKTVRYLNAANPVNTTPRLINFSVFDGNNTDTASTTVNFDTGAPTVDLDTTTAGNNYSVSYSTSGGAKNIANPATNPAGSALADPDGVLRGLTVQLSGLKDVVSNGKSSNDELLFYTIPTGSNITGSYNPATGLLTFTGTDTVANYQSTLASIRYADVASTPTSGQRSATVTVTDGGRSASAITAISVNTQPPPSTTTLDLDTANTSSKNYSGALTTGVSNPITGTVTVTDSDDTLVGATVVLQDAVDANEVLTATDVGNLQSSYANGTLTITGNGTAAEYKQELESIRYTNGAQTPTGTSRHFLITINGGAASDSANSTITKGGGGGGGGGNTSNAAPDLNGALSQGVNFNRNWIVSTTVPTTLAKSDATIINATNATAIDHITVEFYDDPNDDVTTDRQDALAEVITATNTTHVTATPDDTTGTLTLQGPATRDEFITALRSVKYLNTAAAPTGDIRKFIFKLYEDANTDTPTSAITTIKIGGVNSNDIDGDGISNDQDTDADGDGVADDQDTDANGNGIPDDQEGGTGGSGTTVSLDLNGPTLGSVNFQSKWNKSGSSALAASNATLTGPSIQSLTVTINNRQDGDVETLAATAVTGITPVFDEATGVLTLTGPASAAKFQQVLRTISYSNPGSEVTTTNGNGSSGTGTGTGTTTTTTTKTVIHGTSRAFTFTVNAVNGNAASATTTIDTKGNLGIFTVTLSPDSTSTSAILIYTLTNPTSSELTGVSVNGAITGHGHANLDAVATGSPNLVASVGTVTAKLNSSGEIRNIMERDKVGKNVRWYIPTLAANTSATLTITVPLDGDASGEQIASAFTASFADKSITKQSTANVKVPN